MKVLSGLEYILKKAQVLYVCDRYDENVLEYLLGLGSIC